MVEVIKVIPDKIGFLPMKENAGLGEIVIKCIDGKEFSIKSFSTSGNIVTANFDPNAINENFVLHPQADIEKLKNQKRGSIKISLSHPNCRSVRIVCF